MFVYYLYGNNTKRNLCIKIYRFEMEHVTKMTGKMIIVLASLVAVLSFATKLILNSAPMSRNARREANQLWLGLNIGFGLFLLMVIGIEIYY